MTTTVAAHEPAHLAGLRHGDSFGPIGEGIFDRVDDTAFRPAYPGPSDASETFRHLLASGDSVRTTLIEALNDLFFGAREAIKLAFADHGTPSIEQMDSHDSIAEAQPLNLTPLAIFDNTVLVGLHSGQNFAVQAADIIGAIKLVPESAGSGETFISEDDYYSFKGKAGDLFEFEIVSVPLNRFANKIDAELTILDASGNVVLYPEISRQDESPSL